MGLAICHQLLELMHSELHVESEPGRGSTFWFEVALPMKDVTVKTFPPPEQIIKGYQGPQRMVFVVDDVPSNRAILVDLLQPLGS